MAKKQTKSVNTTQLRTKDVYANVLSKLGTHSDRMDTIVLRLDTLDDHSKTLNMLRDEVNTIRDELAKVVRDVGVLKDQVERLKCQASGSTANSDKTTGTKKDQDGYYYVRQIDWDDELPDNTASLFNMLLPAVRPRLVKDLNWVLTEWTKSEHHHVLFELEDWPASYEFEDTSEEISLDEIISKYVPRMAASQITLNDETKMMVFSL